MLRRHLLPSLILTGFVVVALLIYAAAVYGIGQVAFKHKADGSLITRNGQIVGSAFVGQAFSDAKGNPLTQYFQPRPSATSPNPYNASASSASNLGPGDPRLVGFIPGFNAVGLNGQPSKANPFATKADPYCVPLDAKTGDPVVSPTPGEKFQMADGTYVCDSNTVPERTLAYRQLNGLASNVEVPVDAVTASDSGLDPQISIANADLQAPRVARVRNMPLAEVLTLVKKYTSSRSLGFLGEPGVNVLELNLALDRTG
jgi:potassium-transporting ATPase KdpC subunit